jgi:hypothetical protein
MTSGIVNASALAGFGLRMSLKVRRLLDWDVGGISNWTPSITSSVRVSPD